MGEGSGGKGGGKWGMPTPPVHPLIKTCRGYSFEASNEYPHHICFYGELENIIPKFSIAQYSS